MTVKMRVLMILAAIAVCEIPKANTLTCLQCNNIPQPRHCNAVAECNKDEICGIEEIGNAFGDRLFNVGCMKKTKCSESNSTQHCIQCCSSDVCNAEGCGELGYPKSRGPICYNCPVYTNSKACHFIDICRTGEVCKLDSRQEFGDIVFSSGCFDAHACKQGAPSEPSVVGRDIDDHKYLSISQQQRSLSEHTCTSCCDSDLCNNVCNGSTSVVTKYCSSNPCHHGKCYDVTNGFVCVCNHGYEGRQCDALMLPCISNPCMRGNCTNESGGYKCLCPQYYKGTNCETKIYPCASDPCMHGNCTNENDGYTCQCPQHYTGKNCETRMILASDCYEILKVDNVKISGVYDVKLWKSHKTIQVYCDMKTDGGGWTVFQRRFNGSVNFTRRFSDYENGFGSLNGEFWLGDSPGFYYNNGYNFVTYDRDTSYNCAERDRGGWWYGNCAYANLNGEYITPGTTSSYHGGEGGMTYRDFQNYKSLKETKIMYRRV